MKREYFCNCEAACVHKAQKMRKVKIWKEGKNFKAKCQVCLNNRNDCTCRYRTDLGNVFKY